MISVEESTQRDALAKLEHAAHIREGWIFESSTARHACGSVFWNSWDEDWVASARGASMVYPNCFAAMDWVENGE